MTTTEQSEAEAEPRVFAALAPDGLVLNTVLALTADHLDPAQNWVSLHGVSPQPGIGWRREGEDGPFVPPPEPPPAEVPAQPEPTKAELLAQLAALQAKIEALP